MGNEIKETVITVIAATIGSLVGSGIYLYATDKEFKKWIDEKLYPIVKSIGVNFGPLAISLAKEKIRDKFADRPATKEILIELLNYAEKGVVKFSKKFEKRLYSIKDELPELQKELELINN